MRRDLQLRQPIALDRPGQESGQQTPRLGSLGDVAVDIGLRDFSEWDGLCRHPIEKFNRDGDGLLAGQEPALAARVVELVGEARICAVCRDGGRPSSSDWPMVGLCASRRRMERTCWLRNHVTPLLGRDMDFRAEAKGSSWTLIVPVVGWVRS